MPVSKRSQQPVPYWSSDCGRAVVYVGDCLEVMEKLGPEQFHAVVTDPPYGLEFMGKDWDAPWKNNGGVDARRHRAAELSDPGKAKFLQHNTTYGTSDPHGFQLWFLDRAEAILRVAKPGAHLLSFGGTRMWHRMACAVEDAGWEIRDMIAWVYGSGFPKGRDISKAIDKGLGVERTDNMSEVERGKLGGRFGLYGQLVQDGGYGFKENWTVSAPVSDAAKQWAGWNTSLKPALEPVIVARKPMSDSVEDNTMEHGCGGINVDGCRVGTTGATVQRTVQSKASSGSGIYQFNAGENGTQSMVGGYAVEHKDGRWPLNMINDGSPESVQSLPDGADRFFYSAKADNSDRAHGSGGVHPTVKPLDLMCYLVRLVCTKGGIVLDPFMGSGSTLCACVQEGMYGVGIEKSEEYAKIAVDRLKEMLGVHPIVERLASGKRAVRSTPPPPPKRLR